ncbi:UDP-N-acetylglucosamine acetyltransferase [Nitrospira sp. KM1]|uniref:acyl-ACP--UDP-N-acetylglucosamine O-acyltransferase n=1 Tax=Nitrospira sp. KM1 TaxID=1936990 RepID=UPI0013A73616|nr:acyl-ACP--UDP-N-acetylglucosamine O-acyltransferase [Nitrospira sp. KM1]BCA54254.1 UDP-N-acetylglucosamine acetyltransferase [Nitrospira sp. KM1]
MQIHPQAIVHPKAKLADDVVVGPFCTVGEHVTIDAGSRLISHVTVDGWTQIGKRCELHPFVSIGGPPQHLQYKGDPTTVVIGDDNIFREYVTVNRATVEGGGVTSIGSRNFLMAYVHVAHDCHLGSHLILANAASLAGHITIGDHAIIGGLSGIHQYVRIGAYSMVGGCCAIGQDLPPFMRAAGGYRARMYGLNTVGLRRHGFTADRIAVLKKAYDVLFRSGHKLAEAAKLVKAEFSDQPDVMTMLAFLEGTKRGVCRSVEVDQEHEE